jgi:hypothetical protein
MRFQFSHDALKPLCHDIICVVDGMVFIVAVKTSTKLLYWTYVDVLIGISIFVL